MRDKALCATVWHIVPTIQTLNAKTSSHQRAFRVSVWAGSEASPGCRLDGIAYASSLGAAVQRALRAFRAGVGKQGRFSDWTINIEPIRGNEEIVPAEGARKAPGEGEGAT